MPRNKNKPQSDDWRKWDRQHKERLYLQMLDEQARERARDLESGGWESWYGEMYGEEFVKVLADHHREAIQWHWSTIIMRRAGMKLDHDAYFAIWSRGHMKSTIARYLVVTEACLMGIGYCLYVSGTKGKVRGHALSLEGLITSTKVKEYYPRLAVVKRGEQKQSKGWTQDFIYTDAGFVFHFISLDEGVAGANVDSVRPSIIILDDVDDRDDSPLISENRLRVLTRAVLPTKQKNTIAFWAQNLISRHSVLYQVQNNKVLALANRVRTQPIPAFRNLVTELRTVNGEPHDVIVSGEPTWDWFDLERGQEDIDFNTLPSFLVECQHEVDLDKSGQVLPEYNEDVHIITVAEFQAVYGEYPEVIPPHWKRYCGHDWGSSGPEKGHACVVCYLAVAAQNSPHPGTVFLWATDTFSASVLASQVAHSVLQRVLGDLQRNPRTYLEFSLLDRATGNPGDALAMSVRNKVIDEFARRSQWAMFHMSHEQKAVRDIYRIIYGLPFQPCNPGRDGGVAQLRHHLRADLNEPHPFRHGKRGLCRLYLIVADDEARDRPRGDTGLKLLREQLPEWRWRPPTLTSKGYLDERPMKLADDIGNALMMVFAHFQMSATPLTHAERVEQAIPEELRLRNLQANSPFEHGLTPEQELAHLLALARAKRTVKPDIQRFYEGERIN